MNYKNWKIGVRLGAGFAAILALLLVVALVGLNGMGKADDALRRIVDVNVRKMALLEDMSASVHIESRVIRSVALLSDEEEAKVQSRKIVAAREVYDNARAQLEKIPLDDTGKAFVAEISQHQIETRPLNDKFEEMAKSNKDEAVRFLIKTAVPANDKWQNAIKDFIDLQRDKNAKDEQAAISAYDTAREILFTVTALAVVLGAIIAWLATRSITRPLSEAVQVARKVAHGDLTSRIHSTTTDETGQLLAALREMNDSLSRIVGQVRIGSDTIATASTQIAAGNLDLSSRTEEQASSLEETASSMEELTSTVKQNADNAHQANSLANSASDVASRGGAVVAQVVETMAEINESARKIVDIISVIDGIAFQTNILALNAAVEAARAGEQGRGFAVVAAEVRTLAQRSAAAAKEIKELIGNSVEKVDAGSKLVDAAGTTMNEVVESVKRVNDIISEIAAASAEQTAGIEQINRAIMEMDNVTQQNASLVEEAAAAAESMQDQAGSLAKAVEVFKLDGYQATLSNQAAPRRAGPVDKPSAVVRQLPVKNPNRGFGRPVHRSGRIAASAQAATADWEEF